MSDLWQRMAQFIIDLAVYEVNGLLWLMYLVWEHAPLIIAWGCALAVMLRWDREIEDLMIYTPSRGGLRPVVRSRLQLPPQRLTLIVIVLWTVAALAMPNPVPWLGAAMWLTMVASLALIEGETAASALAGKYAIALYAVVVLAVRLGFYVYSVDPAAWVGVVGSVEGARSLVAQGRSWPMTAGIVATWFVVPIGYIFYQGKRLLEIPRSLIAPNVEPADVHRQIRYRE